MCNYVHNVNLLLDDFLMFKQIKEKVLYYYIILRHSTHKVLQPNQIY